MILLNNTHLIFPEVDKKITFLMNIPKILESILIKMFTFKNF